MLFPLLLIPRDGERWTRARRSFPRKVVHSVCAPCRRFLFCRRARTHGRTGSHVQPFSSRARAHARTRAHAHERARARSSIFSQRFPFSFCRARVPPPPFVITPRLKIPYVAPLPLPSPYIRRCLTLSFHRRAYAFVRIMYMCTRYAFIVCTHPCVRARTRNAKDPVHTYTFSVSFPLILFPFSPTLRSLRLSLSLNADEFSSLPDFLRIFPFATSLLRLLVLTCARVRVCVSFCVCRLIDFFPLARLCIHVYIHICKYTAFSCSCEM